MKYGTVFKPPHISLLGFYCTLRIYSQLKLSSILLKIILPFGVINVCSPA